MVSDTEILSKLLSGLLELTTKGEIFISKVVDEMSSILVKKGQDYSGGTEHTWRNFEQSAEFTNLGVDQVFLALIGTKIARLTNLLAQGKTPNFESVEDSWIDLANYIILLVGYKRYIEASQVNSLYDTQELPQINKGD